ncbi:MAG: hypothetical protein EXR75_15905 [Myxococcales bacterium]|nr:hypothetical protein [Myxococcales bacterium]
MRLFLLIHNATDIVFQPPANDAPVAPVVAPRTSLGEGLLSPCTGRIDWASLIRRVYLHDVLACPCGARRRIVADVNELDAIDAILGHLGLPVDAPPIARARDPSYDPA